MISVQVLHGDCRNELELLADNSIDSIVTDPPYELGFMGKSWDASGIAYDPTMWGQCLRAIKPGGHMLAFSGSRTYHRMVCAIEDAGFEIRDQIMWIYGSGFPKSLNIAKQTGSDEWDGWGTALKPAHEPIVLARKPLDGTVANNISTHGTGGLNINGCRHGEGAKKWVTPRGGIWSTDPTAKAELIDNPLGRYPANLIHDDSEEITELLPLDKSKRSASRFFYSAKANNTDRNEGIADKTNKHPTVKPTELMRYLVRLVTPPNGTVLDPFTGSGSTGKAAVLEGFSFIGIEQSEEYVHIAKARIGAHQ